MRCNDIATRGRVPFPPGSAVALKAACLHQLAAAATQRAQLKEASCVDVQCVALGTAKEVQLPPAPSCLCAGGSVTLRLPGSARAGYLLCAHVEGDLWWCHGGSFDGVALAQANPFQLDGLTLKDIKRESWPGEDKAAAAAPPAKRVRLHEQVGGIHQSLLDHPDAFPPKSETTNAKTSACL